MRIKLPKNQFKCDFIDLLTWKKKGELHILLHGIINNCHYN